MTTPSPASPDQSAKATALITEAVAHGPRPITHQTARLIAAAIHEGDGGPLQHFAATGQFDAELLGHDVQRIFVPTSREPWRRALREFVIAMRRAHPWSRGFSTPRGSSAQSPTGRSMARGALPESPRQSSTREPKGVKWESNEEIAVNSSAPQPQSEKGSAQDLVLTIPEAADRLRVSLWTIYRLIREGKLQTIQIGTRRLVPLFALQRFLDAEAGPKDAAA